MTPFPTKLPTPTKIKIIDLPIQQRVFWNFYPPLPPLSQSGYMPWKMKKAKTKTTTKTHEDIIILDLCTTNDDYMFDSWDMEGNRIFCHFGLFFFPFIPLTSWKIKILKKIEKTTQGDIIILYLCNTSDNHIIWYSWDMEHNRQNFLSFWAFFALLPTNNLKNQNFEKMEKTPGGIIILHLYTTNDNMMRYRAHQTEFWQNEKEA